MWGRKMPHSLYKQLNPAHSWIQENRNEHLLSGVLSETVESKVMSWVSFSAVKKYLPSSWFLLFLHIYNTKMLEVIKLILILDKNKPSKTHLQLLHLFDIGNAFGVTTSEAPISFHHSWLLQCSRGWKRLDSLQFKTASHYEQKFRLHLVEATAFLWN